MWESPGPGGPSDSWGAGEGGRGRGGGWRGILICVDILKGLGAYNGLVETCQVSNDVPMSQDYSLRLACSQI